MRTKLFFSLVSFALLFLFGATSARADAIEIVSGTYVIQNAGAGAQVERLSLTGSSNNLILTGFEDDIGLQGCFPCSAGTAVSAAYTKFHPVDSVRFNNADYDRPPFAIGSMLQFNSGSYVLPATSSGTFSVSLPFTLTGHLTVYDQTFTNVLLDTNIFGDGMVTIEYSVVNISGRTLFTIQRTTYDFGAPVPTPEPATLILFGSGLAGAALRFRRRRV